jgi:hypothetical protein
MKKTLSLLTLALGILTAKAGIPYVLTFNGLGTNASFYGALFITNVSRSYIHLTNGSIVASNQSGKFFRLSNNIVVGNPLVFSNSIAFYTNQHQMVPDFDLPAQLMTTNASFTFLAPQGIDPLKLTLQTHAVYVTNSAGNSTLTVTPPGSVHPVGSMFVTNLSRFTFEVWGGTAFTNVFAVPVF